MADKKKEQPVNRRMWMIDPIYKKFTARAFQSLTGTEFFNFFQTMLRNGEHEFQFSNRKLNMQVDERWVEIIEATIPSFVEITRNPRVIITQEELITNVVQAKKIDQQVVKHLCSHSYLVDAIDEEGNVVPNKVLNIFKEETWDTYENRFVYTLMKMTYDFISKRYMDMKEAMNDEFGATLLIKSSGSSDMEDLNVDMKLKIKQKDDLFDKNAKHKSIFTRIEEIYEAMVNLMNTNFAKTMSKFLKVTPPLVPTNAIKKNPHLRKCHKLWDFLLAYFDVGYTVEIIEQNPEINEKFEQDIWDDIMFTYIILKGYLEDNRDRAMDREVKSQRKLLRPRYIKEIVEELVRNFNMNDTEVRKVLIEELTKEQLMREEQSERYRLVEEQRLKKEEEKKQAELEKLRQAKEAEKARKQAERQKERERIQAEKEKARREEQRKKEAERRAELDKKRTGLFTAELAEALGSLSRRREEEVKKRRKQAELDRKLAELKEKTAKVLEQARKKAARDEKAAEKASAAALQKTGSGSPEELAAAAQAARDRAEKSAEAVRTAENRLALLEKGILPEPVKKKLKAEEEAEKQATAEAATEETAAAKKKERDTAPAAAGRTGEAREPAGMLTEAGALFAGQAQTGNQPAEAQTLLGSPGSYSPAGRQAEGSLNDAVKAAVKPQPEEEETAEEKPLSEEEIRQKHIAQQQARMEELRESIRKAAEEKAVREAEARRLALEKAEVEAARQAAAERGVDVANMTEEELAAEVEAARRREAMNQELDGIAKAAADAAAAEKAAAEPAYGKAFGEEGEEGQAGEAGTEAAPGEVQASAAAAGSGSEERTPEALAEEQAVESGLGESVQAILEEKQAGEEKKSFLTRLFRRK